MIEDGAEDEIQVSCHSIGEILYGILCTEEKSNLEDPRLVRRRLRHIAMSGTILHKKYLIGSVTLLPATCAFTILPLPNIPFFWVLFRTYSHWRALQGSEKLLELISNHSNP